MIRRAVAGLAGLGLIGGAGAVIYNHNGSVTVKIKNEKTGKTQTVTIAGATGQTFSCPSGTRAKLEPYDITLGRIKLTLQQVRRDEHAIEKQHPSGRAPGAVVDRYNALFRHDHRLVRAYNTDVDKRNAVISEDCSAG